MKSSKEESQPERVGELPGKEVSGAHLDIDAHAVYQLGAQLITDDEQALLELVKNSYDADSKLVGIKINTTYTPRIGHPFLAPTEKGYIEIEDDGLGMDRDAMLRSWLIISMSMKRTAAGPKKQSPKFKRYPLGDKGLGRLGSMKLGRSLMVESFSSRKLSGYRVFFRWSDCSTGKPLHDVPVRMEEIENERNRQGTTVRIYGLVDPAAWKAEKRAKRLQVKLSSLISPFVQFQDFVIAVSVDGVPVELTKLTPEFRKSAPLRIAFDWNGRRLRISGQVKLSWFKRKDLDSYTKSIEYDNGESLIKYLAENINGFEKTFGLKKSPDRHTFLSFERNVYAEDLLVVGDSTEEQDPGGFNGEIDLYDLDALGADQANVFASLSLFRQFVRLLKGVHVYRDRFGVRMAADWLRMGEAFTHGGGYYSLRPANTIGYVQLSVVGNRELVEKSDREGFVENDAYRGFAKICDMVLRATNDMLNTLGKKSAEYIRVRKGEISDQPDDGDPDLPPPPEVSALHSATLMAKAMKGRLAERSPAHKVEMTGIDAAARRLTWDRTLPTTIRNDLNELQRRIESEIQSLEKDRAEVAGLVELLEEQMSLAAKFRRRYEEFSSRSEILYEMVGVGLAAQALAHDVGGLTSDITGRVSRIAKELRRGAYDLSAMLLQLEAIRSSTVAIVTSTDLIRPMLRASRSVVERDQISKIVHDFMTLRGERLRGGGITWQILCEAGADFNVRFNRGRMIQVFENLLTNSEFWIGYGTPKKPGRITIEIDSPFVTFWDSGRGVREDVEERLFELFVSGKPDSRGSGLGLFIVKKLLERDQCSIALSSERNANGRRYKFVMDLTGIMEAKV